MAVLKYWLEEGADGFRIDAINHMFEVKELTSEQWIDPEGDQTSYDNLNHTMTMNQVRTKFSFLFNMK